VIFGKQPHPARDVSATLRRSRSAARRDSANLYSLKPPWAAQTCDAPSAWLVGNTSQQTMRHETGSWRERAHCVGEGRSGSKKHYF
jgi:hypothetical protein